MPVFTHRSRTSRSAQPLSRVLTNLVNYLDLSAEWDVVVHVFAPHDEPNWLELPPIWHLPNGTDIVVNLGKFALAMANTSDKPGHFLGNKMQRLTTGIDRTTTLALADVNGTMLPVLTSATIEGAANTIERYMDLRTASGRKEFKPFLTDGTVNPGPLNRVHRIGEIGYHYRPNDADDMLANLAIGTVIREAAYAVFTQRQVREAAWFANETTQYQRNIITVFEELRVEYQNMRRIDGAKAMGTVRNYTRHAVPITANIEQVVADMMAVVMSGGEEGASLANIALNSSLVLGRQHYNVLLDYELRAFSSGVDDFVGTDRLAAMRAIWEEYTAITNATEANIMPLVRRWEELFPSDEDGSNGQSSIAPAPEVTEEQGEGEGQGEGKGQDGEGEEGQGQGEGEGDQEAEGSDGEGKGKGEGEAAKQTRQQARNDNQQKSAGQAKGGTKGARANGWGAENTKRKNDDGDPGVEEIMSTTGLLEQLKTEHSKITGSAVDQPAHAEHSYGPKDRTPSRISYAEAEHRYEKGDTDRAIRSGRAIKPSPADYVMAQQLAKVLENLNVSDIGKFKTREILPPGRMNSRAAVQQAAERQLNLPAVATPWRRTRTTRDLNPPLTVGIMTDISGSMGWAEQMVAEFTWIVSHAVNSINGRAAALSFGDGATVVLRPGERLKYAQVVEANGGGEEFDMGAGTLDTMLNLINGKGTRMLFVFTDGEFVFANMMHKREAWLSELNKAGVHVIWVTPEPDNTRERSGISTLPARDQATVVSAAPLYHANRYRSGSSGESEQDKAKRQLIADLGKQVQMAVQRARRNSR